MERLPSYRAASQITSAKTPTITARNTTRSLIPIEFAGDRRLIRVPRDAATAREGYGAPSELNRGSGRRRCGG